MKHLKYQRNLHILVLGLSISLAGVTTASALGSSNPHQSGSTGMQGTISAPAPTVAPVLSEPITGRLFTSSPATVSGLCTSDLLVKVFNNTVFSGAVQCAGGSFSLQIDLFSGQNNLTAIQYDALDQASPTSNAVTVSYQSADFTSASQQVSLTSQYAKLGADIGSQLTWPIILSGGSAPYAISVDWGDGSTPELLSKSFAGLFNITHTYTAGGTYRVTVRATDNTGQAAFLQLVGVGNGKTMQANEAAGSANGSSAGGTTTNKPKVVWWPFAAFFPFVGATFWLGQKYELKEIHRQLERHRDNEYRS